MNSVKTHLRRKTSRTGHSKRHSDFANLRGFDFRETSHICEVSRKLNSRKKFRIYSTRSVFFIISVIIFYLLFCFQLYESLLFISAEITDITANKANGLLCQPFYRHFALPKSRVVCRWEILRQRDVQYV